MQLRRYWLEFDENADIPSVVRLGCGVTAVDAADALKLVQSKIFRDEPLPKISNLIEDVDISTLDHGHVTPNMATPTNHGIWFPKGYDF